MEGDDIDDMHMCLVCQSTVLGLVNYVNHKKYHCPGRKNLPAPTGNGTSLNDHTITTTSVPLEQPGLSLPSSSASVSQNFLSSPEFKADSNDNFHSLNVQTSHRNGISSNENLNEANSTPTTSLVSLRNNNISVDIQENFSSFPSDAFSPSTTHIVDPNMVINTKTNLDKPEDFFSSLALQSKSNVKEQPSSHQHSVQNILRLTFEKESGNNVENELPITNILNSINFSDDDLDFDEDLLEEAFSDDSDENEVPPSNYTRGKWKPGCGPGRPRESGGKWHPGQRPVHVGGKWKPGQGPTGGKLKSHNLRSSGGKHFSARVAEKKIKEEDSAIKKMPVRASGGKNIRMNLDTGEYLCKPCGKYFRNRFCYSNHCGTKIHKRNVKASKFSDNDSGSDTEIDETFVDQKIDFSKVDEKIIDQDGKTNFCDTCKTKFDDAISYTDHVSAEKCKKEDTESKGNETAIDYSIKDNAPVNIELKEVGNGSTENSQSIPEPDNANFEQDQGMNSETLEQNIDQKFESNDKMEDAGESYNPIVCTICNKKFYSKYVMTRHLLSKTHRNRTLGMNNILPVICQYNKYIVRLSPFQCGLCQFYFNRESDLVAHMEMKEHIMQWETLTGEVKCTLCNFSSHSNEEVIEHFQKNILHVTLSKRNQKLCIIKEKNYEASCKFCKKKIHSRVHMRRHVRHKHMMDIDSKGHVSGTFQKNDNGLFQCGYEDCGRKYGSYNAFILHMNRKHSEGAGPIHCKVCDKMLSDRYSYGRHCIGNIHKRNLQKRKFAVKENLIVKVEEDDPHDVDTKIRNRLKDKLVNNPTVRKYVRRKAKLQKNHKIFKCDHCDFTASSYAELRPHYMTEHSNHILLCDICDLKFLSEKALKLHNGSRQHQGNLEEIEGVTGNKRIFSCEICGKKFTDEALKQWHIDVKHLHPNSEEALRQELGEKKDVTIEKYHEFLDEVDQMDKGERLHCIECKKNLKKESILEHLRLHTGDKPFVCRYCKLGFMSALSLRRHLMSHLGLTERRCEVCGKEFKKLESYREHMKCHEMEKAGAQKLICEVCAMEFFLPKQLRAHMRRHGEKTFKCPMENCHWIFHFANELDAHMKTHTNARPFLCDICGYAAGTRNRLNRHHRTHTGERNYHCDYCTYKAGTRTHLRRHMRIHIGTKPYKCPYCSYSCNTHENIRKHIMKTKKHEGMFIYNCKSCKFGANTVNDFRVHLQVSHPDQYELSRNIEGLAQLTGLYIKQEDVDKPSEGMKINPIKERRSRDDQPQNKRHRMKKREMINIDPLFIHEEVVAFENEDYTSYQQDQSSDRNWQPTSQMELEQAVKVVEADSQNFDEQRQFASHFAAVENVMLLDSARRVAVQHENNHADIRQHLQKNERAINSSATPLVLPNFVEYKPHVL